jgi:hypothetical protein
MLIINIEEFENYTAESFLEFLQIHQPNVICLEIPKLHHQEDMPELIPMDYYRAAYIGQLLAPLCEELLYDTPHPAKKDPFCFHIILPRCEQLAVLLGRLAAVFGKGDDETDMADFCVEATGIWLDKTRPSDIVCYEYLQVIEDL